jgi:hypothetical protein
MVPFITFTLKKFHKSEKRNAATAEMYREYETHLIGIQVRYQAV